MRKLLLGTTALAAAASNVSNTLQLQMFQYLVVMSLVINHKAHK